ncbi:hypothetical protein QEH56_06320 [Pelagicoccus enzymogenes]|uniref:hypothetical protein n=1 Tax=Pelagicoccus enzymogenes TaxID=2773457 RepID=UPI00280FA980|nr:hypothetical protein [Pelagicoccus enzymogenes]MDQ8197755.1 hypothetical protein [Pelagicoccus enzymogenes]
MKVHTIEIASAIEQELKSFLKDWGGGYPMKFTRFIDTGGRQTDLYVYTAEPGASPWMIVRIKCVMKSDQGECIQVFVNVAGKPTAHEETLVSPEVWKLPALADRVLTFAKNDMLAKVAEGGDSLPEGGGAGNLGSGSKGELGEGTSSDDDEDYDDLDTAGILAGDGGGASMDFNPEDVIAQANSGSEDDVDPSDLIAQMNAEREGSDGDDVDDPSSLIQQMNEESDEEEDK